VQAQHDAQETKRSFLRILRQVLDPGLLALGVVVILSAVFFVRELRGQVAIVLLGILLIEVGVWKLAHPLLPSERRYLALRCEVDLFVTLVRQLNTAALMVKANDSPAHRHEFEEVQQAMRQTVERIFAVAGKTDAELASECEGMVEQEVRPGQKEWGIDTASPE
jgi:hypothetical protein